MKKDVIRDEGEFYYLIKKWGSLAFTDVTVNPKQESMPDTQYELYATEGSGHGARLYIGHVSDKTRAEKIAQHYWNYLARIVR